MPSKDCDSMEEPSVAKPGWASASPGRDFLKCRFMVSSQIDQTRISKRKTDMECTHRHRYRHF